jgi:hypothetical protein
VCDKSINTADADTNSAPAPIDQAGYRVDTPVMVTEPMRVPSDECHLTGYPR